MRGNGKEEYGWAGKKRLFRRMDMGMIPQRLPYGGMTRIRFGGTLSPGSARDHRSADQDP